MFRTELARLGVPTLGDHYIVPVPIGEDTAAVEAAERLQSAGYDVRAIRPPTVPEGTCRLRLSIHADHDPMTLTMLAAAIAEVFARPGENKEATGSDA